MIFACVFFHLAFNLSLKTQLQCFFPILPQVKALTLDCRTRSYAQKGCSPYRAELFEGRNPGLSS